MTEKTKTLGDYISLGKHEFVAFVKNRNSPQSSNHKTIGNDLGKIYFGVLVCEKGLSSDNDLIIFYHKQVPTYKDDSNIMFTDFGYQAKVITEVPLSLETSFWSSNYLKKRSKEFKEAKKLLQNYGLY